jgi:hypothetical protein
MRIANKCGYEILQFSMGGQNVFDNVSTLDIKHKL